MKWSALAASAATAYIGASFSAAAAPGILGSYPSVPFNDSLRTRGGHDGEKSGRRALTSMARSGASRDSVRTNRKLAMFKWMRPSEIFSSQPLTSAATHRNRYWL